MKKKYYYKIVNYNLRSLIIDDTIYPNIGVQYKINEFVEPNINGTKLMIFTSLYHAQNFLYKEHKDGKIYKVEALGVSKYGILLSFRMFSIMFNKCLKLKKNKKGCLIYNSKIPNGTLFAKKVKLVEMVYWR
jgi:hypothetical protein